MTGLGDVMQVWATLDDVQKAKPKYKNLKSWAIVNTKFSLHARKYSEAKGLKLCGWNYPTGESLEDLVEGKRTYPITILKLKKQTEEKLSENGILLVGEIADMPISKLKRITRLPNRTIDKIKQEANQFLRNFKST